MPITIKSKSEQDLMRRGGSILASILDEIEEAARPGIKKSLLEKKADDLSRKYKVTPSFRGYGGYPSSICVSVNEEIVHGIPNNTSLKEGDLVKIDMGVNFAGFNTDSARSFICGKSHNRDAENLIKVCEQSFYSGVKLIKDGVHLGDISAEIQKIVEEAGYGVVRMLVGHGIGKDVHEDPQIPNYGTKGTGPILKSGMTLAIEPMIIADGSVDVVLSDDGWTYRSKTGALTAHYEHTVLVTDTGYEILTQ